jgi:hypothetical protein
MQGADTAHPLFHLGQPGTVMLMLAVDNGQGATTATHTIVVTAGSAGNNGAGGDGDTPGGSDLGSFNEAGGSGTLDASVAENASTGAGGMPVWLPFAIVGFVAAFLAVGALLVAGRRK